jgi:hypothetical protein
MRQIDRLSFRVHFSLPWLTDADFTEKAPPRNFEAQRGQSVIKDL